VNHALEADEEILWIFVSQNHQVRQNLPACVLNPL
jgi:hypothetical protein